MQDTLLCEPVPCELVGINGNAFALLGHWTKCARKAGRSADEISAVVSEATCNNYDHLLMTLVKHCTED